MMQDTQSKTINSLKTGRPQAEIICWKLGIPPNRISLKAFGESKPAFDNLKSETKKLNRRIEIKITRM